MKRLLGGPFRAAKPRGPERPAPQAYERVSVIVAFVIGTTQVLDDTVIGPVSVEVAPMVAVIVPVI